MINWILRKKRIKAQRASKTARMWRMLESL